MSIWSRGVVLVAALVAALGLVGGCGGGPVEVDAPELDTTDRAACQAFVDDLPATLAGEDEREIDPSDALGSAYGDPEIVVTCGVGLPQEYDRFASCEVANGVGWFVPLAQIDDQDADVTFTSVGYRPIVQIALPHGYRPEGPAAAIAELAAPVKAHLKLVNDCA